MVPRCPQCGVEVLPHWDRCEECGYSHHDDDELLGPPGDDLAPPPPPPPPPAAPGFFDEARPGDAVAAGPGSFDPPSGGFDDLVAYDLPPVEDLPPVGGPVDDLPPPPPPPPPPGDGPIAPPPPADPLGEWEAQAARQPDLGTGGRAAGGLIGASAPLASGPPPPTSEPPPAAGDDDAGGRRPGKRVTAADAVGQRSPFALNRVVVGVVAVLAVLVLVWQASSLLASDDQSAKPAPTGTTIPPLGDVVTTTTPLTTPDGVTIVPPSTTTTTIDTRPQCDSATSVYSADGRGYRPCGGGFQVDLPGRAEVRSITGATPVGEVRWTVLSSTDNSTDPWVRSVVAYGDLPREPTPEEVAGVEEALVTQLYGKVESSTTFQDLPALTFSTVDPNGEEVTGIAFVRGTKAFAVATRSEGSPDAAFDQLRDSFAFL